MIEFFKNNLGLVSALFASILWGLNYVLFEKVMSKTNMFTILFFDYLICTVVFGILWSFFGNLKSDFQNLYDIKEVFLINTFVFLIANFLIIFSIKHSNAIIAGLIEISYPLFIVMFSFIILKQTTIDLNTIIGGILILVGVLIISLK